MGAISIDPATGRKRFVIRANGILTTPRLARIDGMETFAGESFHTSRWNYGVNLAGKRVGIIGTGATAVQAVPELAKSASVVIGPSTSTRNANRNTRRRRLAQVQAGRAGDPRALSIRLKLHGAGTGRNRPRPTE